MNKSVFEKSICVVGLGYIGLPTAVTLARSGYSVVGVDSNKDIVSQVNFGQSHIDEPDLDISLKETIQAGKLVAHHEPQVSDIYIICVPTPFQKDGQDQKPDISYVLDATKSIIPFLKNGDAVIIESTCPVGTTETILETINGVRGSSLAINLAYCPERVLPGKIMSEIIENDRIVGGVNLTSTQLISEFYRSFVSGSVWETDAKTAEMAKLVENSFRDVNIAFANELSMFCDDKGVDVWDVISLANKHPRVNILRPGAGVGGHCIAVDPWFLVASDENNTNLIKAARNVNDLKAKWVANKISDTANGIKASLGRTVKIACLGLSYKPDVGDIRESPAVIIARLLQDTGFNVVGVDPHVAEMNNLELVSMDWALENCDIFAVLVHHKKILSHDSFEQLRNKNVLDFCGAFN